MYLPFLMPKSKQRRFIMSKNQALQQFKEDLYVSYSQIFVYLTCGLNKGVKSSFDL